MMCYVYTGVMNGPGSNYTITLLQVAKQPTFFMIGAPTVS